MMDVGGRAIRPLGVQLIGCQDRDPPRPGSVSIPAWPPSRAVRMVAAAKRRGGRIVPTRSGRRPSVLGRWRTSWRYPRMGRMDEKSARRTLDRGRDAARSHVVAVGESVLEGLGESVVGEARRPRAPAGGGSGRTCWPECRCRRTSPVATGRPIASVRREADRCRRNRTGEFVEDPQLAQRADTDARRTQGWSQPARASAVDSTTMAASRKPATATFRVPRQRNERLMEGNDLADRR